MFIQHSREKTGVT